MAKNGEKLFTRNRTKGLKTILFQKTLFQETNVTRLDTLFFS